jgi:hypothetical protein
MAKGVDAMPLYGNWNDGFGISRFALGVSLMEYLVALIAHGDTTPSDCLGDTFATREEADRNGREALMYYPWAASYVIQEVAA